MQLAAANTATGHSSAGHMTVEAVSVTSASLCVQKQLGFWFYKSVRDTWSLIKGRTPTGV
jgi:hypothetical protein